MKIEVRRNVVWACARDAQTLTDLHRLHAREHVPSVRGAISVGTTVEAQDAGE